MVFNKFDHQWESALSNNGHSDLSCCLQDNIGDLGDLPDNFEVLGEILSEHHDEGTYYWLVRDAENDHKMFVIFAGHDYTGWGCQSSAGLSEGFDSLDQLHLAVEEYDNQNRPVRETLRTQALEYAEKFASVL